jgi:hypothetical protein
MTQDAAMTHIKGKPFRPVARIPRGGATPAADLASPITAPAIQADAIVRLPHELGAEIAAGRWIHQEDLIPDSTCSAYQESHSEYGVQNHPEQPNLRNHSIH